MTGNQIETVPRESFQAAENTKDETSVTLSFGGVDFCLAPAELMGTQTFHNDEPLFSITRTGKGMKIQLTNFSGTLSVSSSPPKLQQTSQEITFPHSSQSIVEEDGLQVNQNQNRGSNPSSPFRASQVSYQGHRASATPSPPKSPNANHDPQLKEMVSSMPALTVPSFTFFPRNMTPKVSWPFSNRIFETVKLRIFPQPIIFLPCQR